MKIRKLIAGTSLHWRGDLGAEIKLGLNYQSFKIDKTPGRFITTQNNINFNNQDFLNAEASYMFENTDNACFYNYGNENRITSRLHF